MSEDGPSSSKKRKPNLKIFNDPVHGTIELHPLCVLIIDTPQFQRLRRIKQIGFANYVYPGATHNRFEHSIGVAHLAVIMVKELHQRQPELEITPIEILCVTIAGLCHDLGHGPFSDTFDEQFTPRVGSQLHWTHEKASIDMFDHLIKVNNMRCKFIEHGFNETTLDTDLLFIKELIYGILPGKWILEGRRGKPFLYEIVANKRTSVDVDKWDYFARDCLMVGMKSNFDHMRCIKFTRAIKFGPDNTRKLCLRDKEVSNIYEMFHIRNYIRRLVCKHAVTLAVEMMFVDALVLAEESRVIAISGEDGTSFNISECIKDMVAYTKLTDNIFNQILHHTDDRLTEARELLERVENRKLYKCIGQAILPTDAERNEMTRRLNEQNVVNRYVRIKEIEQKALNEVLEKDRNLTGKIAMKFVDFGYKDNPINNMLLYSKAYPDVAREMRANEEPQLVPKISEEFMINIYYKDIAMEPAEIDRAKKAFAAWCSDKKYTLKAERWNGTAVTQ